MFSFGIVLYQIAAGGEPPFARQFRNELDEAILQGEPIEPISIRGHSPWPDAEDLIDLCIQRTPEDRPSVGAFFLYFGTSMKL